MQLPIWFEVGSLVLLVLILVADLLLVVRRPHVPSMREAGLWVGFYVLLALAFCGSLAAIGDVEHAGQFLAGWLTEYSLSIDNLFVFVLIMSRFSVPRKQQQEVLMVGIIIALVLRGVFILLGATLISHFSWVFYLFGLFLVYTGARQAFGSGEASEDDSALIRYLRRRFKLSHEFSGMRLRVRTMGETYFTPMLLVLLSIGTTDLIFALDSIPAIFGITREPFIVFAANLFALMGLRQLYFLLGGLLERLEYLKYGIAVVLGFIGVKLFLHAMHENTLPFVNGGEPIKWAPEISTWTSLGVIVGAMTIATVASLISASAAARRHGSRLRDEVPHFTED